VDYLSPNTYEIKREKPEALLISAISWFFPPPLKNCRLFVALRYTAIFEYAPRYLIIANVVSAISFLVDRDAILSPAGRSAECFVTITPDRKQRNL
jgi:hypothetical protein